MDCKKNQSIGLGWNKDRLLPQGNDQQADANILLGHERQANNGLEKIIIISKTEGRKTRQRQRQGR